MTSGAPAPWALRALQYPLASVTLVSALVAPQPWSDVLRYSAMAVIMLDLVWKFRVGYQRRRQHWTRDSWWRFGILCLLCVASLVMMFATMYALEARLPITGAPRSPQRAVWAVSVIVFMLIGAIGLSLSAYWFARGEPAKQFAWPRVHFRPPPWTPPSA